MAHAFTACSQHCVLYAWSRSAKVSGGLLGDFHVPVLTGASERSEALSDPLTRLLDVESAEVEAIELTATLCRDDAACARTQERIEHDVTRERE